MSYYLRRMSPEEEVQRECQRLGIKNEPRPDECPKCGSGLASGGGMVGEEILYCPDGCGIFWTDNVDAIRRVY